MLNLDHQSLGRLGLRFGICEYYTCWGQDIFAPICVWDLRVFQYAALRHELLKNFGGRAQQQIFHQALFRLAKYPIVVVLHVHWFTP